MMIRPNTFHLALVAAPNILMLCAFVSVCAFCTDFGPPLTRAAPGAGESGECPELHAHTDACCAEPEPPNLLCAEEVYFGDQLSAVTFYTYDDDGRLVLEEVDFSGDGTVNDTYRYEYDEEGRLSATHRSPTGSLDDGTTTRRLYCD